MIILGIILVLIGWFVPIHILFVVGIVLVVVGAVFEVLGQTGRPVGGRRWW